jgi:hypothetical protein
MRSDRRGRGSGEEVQLRPLVNLSGCTGEKYLCHVCLSSVLVRWLSNRLLQNSY